MQFLFDLFPVILFFATYKFYGIYVATAVIIAAVTVQVGVIWLKERRLKSMHLLTLGLVVLFGGATLALRDPLFIKWKPTILQWLLAGAFVVSHWIGKSPLIKRMMGGQIELPDPVWIRLSAAWILFFMASGGANLYVAFNYSEDAWVNFKLFGLMGMTVLFVVAQAFYLAPYLQGEEKGAE